MIKKKFNNYYFIAILIILWSLVISVRRAFIAPIFDHEAHGYLYGGYFYESNGLLYIFLVQCLKRIFGAPLFVIRFMPIIANLGSCYLLYKISAYIFNKKIAVLAMFFYAIHPMTYYYASYSRFYAFGVFFVLLACYLTIKACDNGSTALWIAAGIAYLCALNSWILTLIIMIGLWLYLFISGALGRNFYKRILLIALAVLLNYILLILLDINAINRINNFSDLSLYDVLNDIYGLAGVSDLGNCLANYVCSKFFLGREKYDSYVFMCFIIYFSLSLLFMDRYCVSKYRCLPPFLFFISLIILSTFSVWKISLYNSKNLYLLLPIWIMMFSVMVVKFRILILVLVAIFGYMANYVNNEGYMPEYQLRHLLERSAKIYISDYCYIYLNYYHIKIGKQIVYSDSQKTAKWALRDKKPCWLLTNLNYGELKNKIISEQSKSRVFIYGNSDKANNKLYFIVPSVSK